MEEEKKSECKQDWTESMLKLAVSAATSMGKNFVEGLHKKIDRAIASALRNIFILFLVLLGIIFLMVGLAQGIGEYLGASNAIGYISIGAIAIIVAALVNYAKKE